MAGSSVRRALQSSVGPKPTATHALVDFGDEGTAIVPFSRLVEGSTSKGKCRVKWNDGEEYDGELIVAGMYKDCINQQKQLERKESDEEEELLMDTEKQTRKRKRKLIKGDNDNKQKNKKLSDDQDKNKKKRNKDAGGTKDDFIIHITKLPQAAKEDENNLDESTRVADGSKGVTRGSTTAADCSTAVVDSGTGSSDSDTDDEISTDDEVQQTFHKTIVLPGGIHDCCDKCDEGSDDIDTSLKKLKEEMRQLNDEQNRRFEEIMLRFNGIEDQLKLLFTSGIAAALSSPQNSTSMSSLPLNELVRRLQPGMITLPAVTPTPVTATPVTRAPVTPTPITPTPVTRAPVTPTPITPTPVTQAPVTPTTVTQAPVTPTTVTQAPVTPTTVTPTPVVAAPVNALATGNIDEELIHPSALCPLMMRYKTRRSLAAAMVNQLFDTETRLKSNVRGRGKDKLDPRKIEYVKRKCFELFPSSRDSDVKKDWDDCIVAIDDKGRELKRQLKKLQDKS